MKVSVYLIFFTVLAIILFGNCGDDRGFSQGKILYENLCGNCHMEDGKGLGQLVPPIYQSDYYKANLEKVPCIIMGGLSDTIVVNGIEFDTPMAAISNLNMVELTNILNYMNARWFPELDYVTIQEVERQLSACTEGE